jgi:hypothetical protein
MSARTALPLLTIWEDIRQQRSYRALFEALGISCVTKTLPEADLTTELLWKTGAIEIKRDDFGPAVGGDRPRVDRMIERLQSYRFKCIIVADDLTSVYRKTQVHVHAILGTVASWYARRDCPVLFAGNDAGAARLAAGILRRWEERLLAERNGGRAA